MSKNYDSFIFTHIHKCGGTSFRSYINGAALTSGISKSQIYIPGENGLGVRRNLDQLSSSQVAKFNETDYKVVAMHSYYGVHENLKMENPLYYTILRDPIERYLSHYQFFNYTLGGNGCKAKTLDDLDLDFATHLIQGNANLMCKLISGTKDINSVTEEAMLSRAKDNLENNYGTFGILDQMDDSIILLKENAPTWLRFEAPFPTLNANSTKQVEHSGTMLDLITAANAQDIQLYDFAVKMFTNRKSV